MATKTKYPPGFERFWAAWPKNTRRSGKSYCYEKYWKPQKLEAKADDIVAVIEALSRSRDWLKDDKTFVPLQSTWLCQKRWDCEVADIAQVGRPRRVQVAPAGPDEMAIVREFKARPESVQDFWKERVAQEHPDLPPGPLTYNAAQAWWQAKQGERG